MVTEHGNSVAIIFCCVFSICACLTVFFSFFLFPQQLRKTAEEIIFYILIGNILGAIGNMAGEPRNGTSACWYEALATNIFVLSSSLWTIVLGNTLYCFTVKGYQLEITSIYHWFCWGIPLLVTILPLINVTYGSPDHGLCWLVNTLQSPSWALLFWFWISFYGLFLICVGSLLWYMVLIYYHGHYFDKEAMYASVRMVEKLRLYLCALVFSWGLLVIYRLWILVDSDAVKYTTFHSAAVILPALQGVFTSCAYWTTNLDLLHFVCAYLMTGDLESPASGRLSAADIGTALSTARGRQSISSNHNNSSNNNNNNNNNSSANLHTSTHSQSHNNSQHRSQHSNSQHSVISSRSMSSSNRPLRHSITTSASVVSVKPRRSGSELASRHSSMQPGDVVTGGAGGSSSTSGHRAVPLWHMRASTGGGPRAASPGGAAGSAAADGGSGKGGFSAEAIASAVSHVFTRRSLAMFFRGSRVYVGGSGDDDDNDEETGANPFDDNDGRNNTASSHSSHHTKQPVTSPGRAGGNTTTLNSSSRSNNNINNGSSGHMSGGGSGRAWLAARRSNEAAMSPTQQSAPCQGDFDCEAGLGNNNNNNNNNINNNQLSIDTGGGSPSGSKGLGPALLTEAALHSRDRDKDVQLDQHNDQWHRIGSNNNNNNIKPDQPLEQQQLALHDPIASSSPNITTTNNNTDAAMMLTNTNAAPSFGHAMPSPQHSRSLLFAPFSSSGSFHNGGHHAPAPSLAVGGRRSSSREHLHPTPRSLTSFISGFGKFSIESLMMDELLETPAKVKPVNDRHLFE